LIPVIPAAFFLDEIPFCFRLFGNIQYGRETPTQIVWGKI
jgi:hypothetical protein